MDLICRVVISMQKRHGLWLERFVLLNVIVCVAKGLHVSVYARVYTHITRIGKTVVPLTDSDVVLEG